VGSRVLIGAGAWMLGALTATGGSLYAVDQLGQGLLEQHTKQVSVAIVNAELALESSGNAGQAPTQSPSLSVSPAPAGGTTGVGVPDKAKQLGSRKASAPEAGAAKLLTSPGGTAGAICRGGLAHLLYWSPAQGFEVFGVQPGPAAVASVTFTEPSGGVTMHVACTGSSVPAVRTSPFNWGSGSHHDE
jgi:hypothetical protein